MTPRPGSCAHLSSPRRRAPVGAGEHGAVAIVAAAGAFLCAILLTVVLGSGYLMQGAMRLRNYADAWATANGLQVLLEPRQQWSNNAIHFSASQLAQANGFETAPDIVSRYIEPSGRLNERELGLPFGNSLNDGWSPVFTQAVFTKTVPMLGFTGLLDGLFGGYRPPALRATGMARVNQVNLSSSTLYRERVMLMLDVSRSMRLDYYTGKGSALDGERALAKALINKIGTFYDLGVLAFSDGEPQNYTLNEPLTSQANSTNSYEAEKQIRSEMANRAAVMSTAGDGTNIQAALQVAAGYLYDSPYKDLPFRKSSVIIVSDGEPNLSNNVRPNSGRTLEQAQADAASETHNAMEDYWSKTRTEQGTQIPDGIDSLVIQIQRENNSLNTQDTDFLKSMAGNAKRGGAQPPPNNGVNNNFWQDGGDPESSIEFIARQPIYPTCQMESLTTIPYFVNRPWLLPRRGKDRITAYLGYSGAGDYDRNVEVKIPEKNIFIDDAKAWGDWILDASNAVRLDPSGNNHIEGGFASLQNSANMMAVYWDSSAQQAWVSNMLCAALQSPENLGETDSILRLRLRWGAPHLLDGAANFLLYE